ncbi:uncharacterized protein LOC134820621 [Bolinopsis microptera]|uniref:uncharacterized protein LOC134820621 n=1 Tax=Bolinopsis microptera TaxID=2820187 RepID=UPI003078DFCC
MRNILSDKNGPARIAIALTKTAPSIVDKEDDFEFITDQLNDWFIFVQRKLRRPVAKLDVTLLVEYFNEILLTQDIANQQWIGLNVRNILVNLLNFLSISEQTEYVAKLVQELTQPLSDTSKNKQVLEMLKKLGGRGRCGIIRRSENNAILYHLVSICLSQKERNPENVTQVSLKLLIMLYESPHYIKEHQAMKTNEFVQFLTRGQAADKYNDECNKILRFLMFNDPKNDVLRLHILDADKHTPLLVALAKKMNKQEKKERDEKNGKDKDIGKLLARHNCCISKSKNASLITLGFFAMSYLKDTFFDLVLAADKIIFRKGNPVLAWLLLAFAIFPLLVCNVVSLKNFYSSTPLSVFVSLEGHVPRYRLLKYVFPWQFDSVKHVVFNLLTFLQLQPLITVVDHLYHHVQSIENILKSQYNIRKVKCLESMLENIPCLAIKIVQVATQIEEGHFDWTSTWNIFEIVSMANSLYSLSKSFLDFEKAARFVDYDMYQIRLKSQKAMVFFGYLTMISSRMLLFLILARFELWVLIVAVSIHILVTFLINLFTYHVKAEKDGSEDEHFVFLRRFDLRLIPFALSEGFLVLLRSPMEYIGIYPNFQYARRRWQFFGIYFMHLTEILMINLCFLFLKLNNALHRHQAMSIISIVSMGLYILSGLFFAVYFFVVHPKKKESSKFVPKNKSLELQLIEPEHDDDWRKKPCLKVKDIFNINGTTLPSPDDRNPYIGLNSETEEFDPNNDTGNNTYIKQRSKFKINGKKDLINI